VGWIRRHPILTGVAFVALAILGLVLATAVAVWHAAHTDDARRVDRADAIIVLGAAQYDGRPTNVFVGRLEQAVLLYHEGRASTVIVVGGKQPGDQTTEGSAGRDYLIQQGLPADAVVAEPVGNDTYESLQGAAKFMHAHGMQSAFLVSDPWHNLRIKRMAGDLGITPYASATWRSAARSETTRLEGYARETFAYLDYRIFGGH
jgi:uncharacterized SAM-binding protein YcdF (DUF218 family)